jgi:hypothetical protein
MKALTVRVRTLILLTAALWMASTTSAQGGGTGAVTGTVRDASGALIPSAQVRLVGEHIHASRSVHTSTRGTFGASLLPAGTYSVVIEAKGFERRYMTAVPVVAGEFTRLYLKLENRHILSDLPVNVARTEMPRFGSGPDEVTIGRLHPDYQSLHLVAAIPIVLVHTAVTVMNGGVR